MPVAATSPAQHAARTARGTRLAPRSVLSIARAATTPVHEQTGQASDEHHRRLSSQPGDCG